MPALLWMKAIDKRALSWGDVLEKPYEKYWGKVGRGVAKNGGLAVRVRFWYCQKPFPTARKSVSDLLKNQRWTLQKRFLRGWSAVLITSKHLVVRVKNSTINIMYWESVIYKNALKFAKMSVTLCLVQKIACMSPVFCQFYQQTDSCFWPATLCPPCHSLRPHPMFQLQGGKLGKNTIVIKRVKACQSPPLLVSCFRHWDTQICKYQEAYLLISN